MRYIKVYLSKGNPVSVAENQFNRILESSSQIIKILNETGKWTGELINKAFIVKTEIDHQRKQEERMKFLKLEEPKNKANTLKELKTLKEKLFKKNIVKK